ncbi:TPA: EexN family lipoprotein [Escherichia coli]|uniref:EexN family lipoprotein n=1 Tax=Escherichia coli TaxID=562 RepID=UPI001C8338DB|nr:EexN family lipoprotein [Escherichia coli]MBX6739709.1 EexN family lipoprotein [Escherichia coli]HAX2124087.1 EexN family lipoprotein [Escherichia coli]
MSYMKKTRILSLVLFSIALSGCSEEIKSVDWWGQHLTEAKQKQVECEKSGSDSQNCKNVKQALFIQSQKDAPVLTFD